jgi:hypothetical protein
MNGAVEAANKNIKKIVQKDGKDLQRLAWDASFCTIWL